MPAPLLGDIDVANRALARIGEFPVASLDEDTDQARQVAAVYEDVLEAALTLYQWKWARRTEMLQAVVVPAAPPLVTPPIAAPAALAPPAPQPPYFGAGVDTPPSFNGWRYAFSVPSDAIGGPLGLYLRWPGHPTRDFALEGSQIYAHASTLYGTFLRRLTPDQWPAGFRLAVTTWIAAELAVPVTHDKDLAAALMAEAIGTPSEGGRGGKIGRAIAMDVSTGGPSAAYAGDPVTEARWEGPLTGAGQW